MRAATLALFLGCACLLSPGPATGQKQKPEKPTLTARLEVDAHEHSFTIRFFLKNTGEKEVEVEYGRGGGGMQVVPRIHVAGVYITPPVYSRPPRRSMRPDVKRVPPGKEVLYGSFTMGYPPIDRRKERDEDLSATIQFRELKATIEAKAVRLKVPALKPME